MCNTHDRSTRTDSSEDDMPTVLELSIQNIFLELKMHLYSYAKPSPFLLHKSHMI